ncbi:hypothetical protein M514_11279 [Trichuris suis]|uniref:Major facilitator superfamily (MFS) profile domain-containing protein n=1 Tax=Trichuris suis TaxID=68888 RepID=A0A085LSB9_9BILA|nr:hypothetical protein M513_11279 [Trichuris suis]KFD70658.1 hypothetical protein M514_11279 [Trichuris suis]
MGSKAVYGSFQLEEQRAKDQQNQHIPPSPSAGASTKISKPRGVITLIALALSNTCSTVVFSCIAPFYPLEAQQKGASRLAIGILFGIYELTTFFMSPFFGRLVSQIGSRVQFSMGMCIVGFSSFLFGLLKWCPNGWGFVALSILIRMVEAIGNAAFVTASFSIVMGMYPNRVASSLVGGFALPFWVLGATLALAGFVAFCFIPDQNEGGDKCTHSKKSLLAIPIILVMNTSVVLTAASMAFFDPTLAAHLKQFDLSPKWIGIMFTIVGATYLILTPVSGYLSEKMNCGAVLMTLGSFAACAGFFLIGPSPLVQISKSITVVALSLFCIGCALASLMIPPINYCLQAALKRGHPNNIETFGQVSGLLNASLSLGGFLGPTIGTAVVHFYGFRWTATGFSFLHLFFAFVLFLTVVLMGREKQEAAAALNDRKDEAKNAAEFLLPEEGRILSPLRF